MMRLSCCNITKRYRRYIARNISSSSTSFSHPDINEKLIRSHILNNKQNLIQKLNKYITGLEADWLKKEAGVLIPLCIVNKQLSILYTLRSDAHISHAAQVCFPGGLRNSTDHSVIHTALREVEEEIGYNAGEVDVWTMLPSIPDQNNIIKIVPVLGYLGEIELNSLDVDELEVDDVFTIPIVELLKKENFSYTKFDYGLNVPVITKSPYRIWGTTAVCTDIFLNVAFPDIHKLILYDYTEKGWRRYNQKTNLLS